MNPRTSKNTASTKQVRSWLQGNVKHTLDDAKASGRSLLDQQRQKLADEIRSLGQALHASAVELDNRSKSYYRNSLESVAQKLDEYALFIRDQDTDNLVASFRNIAREKPVLYYGGLFTAGFALSRAIRALAATQGQEKKQGEASGDDIQGSDIPAMASSNIEEYESAEGNLRH